MLGTVSFEPWFKSYCLFTVWSLEFLEIAKQPLSPSSSSLLCFPPPPLCSAVAGAVESLSGHVLSRAGAHASSCPSSTAHCLALELPCRATLPRAARRPPPRRRGGKPAAEAAALSSRAPGHYKSPSKLIRSPFRLLLTSRPQNTPPLHRERRRAPPRRRPTIPQLLRPR